MQTQTHVPNAILGQVSRMAQQNGSSLPVQSTSIGGSAWRRTWHMDTDVALRRTVVDNILQLFQKRRGNVTSEWQQKLPDFVKRLEEALYRNAATKEEYADQQTLETRLQSVAKRMTRASQNVQQHGSQNMTSSSLGNMMPTPGTTMIPTPGNMSVAGGVGGNSPCGPGNMVPTAGTVSNMVPTPGGLTGIMPTPGHANVMLSSMSNMISSSGKGNMTMSPGHSMNSMFTSTGSMIPTPGASGNSLLSSQSMGGMRMTQNGNLGMSMGLQGGGSQMIPTPGLTTSQGVGMNQLSSPGLSVSSVTIAPLQQQPQSFGAVASGHLYRNLNGPLGSTLNNIVQQRKNAMTPANGMSNGMQMMGSNQHLMNGNTTIHNQPSYLNSNQLSSMQVQSHHHHHHHHQQQQQRANQQRQQQMRLQTTMTNPMVSMSEGYAMNAADLAGLGSLYPPVSSGGLTAKNLSMNASSSPPSKMIPVPGLPSQQNSSHLQQAHQPQQLQRSNVSQNPAMARNQLPQPQQHQLQIPKSQALYQSKSSPNLSVQKLPAGNLLQDQSQQQSPTNQMALPMIRPLFDSQPSSPHLQRQQPFSLQQQQQLNVESQQQPQQRQGMIEQQNNVTYPQQARQQVSQVQQKLLELHQQLQQSSLTAELQVPNLMSLSAVQQLRLQQQVQQHPLAHSQQQQRQMLQLPQMQQDHHHPHHLQQQHQHQHPLPAPVSGQQQQQLASANGLAMAMQSAPPLSSILNGGLTVGQSPTGAVDPQRAQQYSKQQRWLLFLRHASKCTAAEGQCNISPHCHMARQLWTHLGSCRERDCQYTRCNASRTLLHHYRQCTDSRCPVCGPVKQMINQKRPQATQSLLGQSSPATISSAAFSMSSMINLVPGGTLPALASTAAGAVDVELQPPPAKRVKLDPGSSVCSSALEPPQEQISSKCQVSPQIAGQQQVPNRHLTPARAEIQNVVKMEGAVTGASTLPKMELPGSQMQSISVTHRLTQVKVELSTQLKGESPMTPINSVKPEPPIGGVDVPPPLKQENVISVATSTITNVSIAKSGKPKIVGTSLTELFTPEMIREHITGLRQWVGQSKAKAEKNQAMEHQMSENACRLCAVEKLTFEPPPIYCTACGARIKRNALYYTAGSGETRHYFCIPCYNEIRTDTVDMDGISYLKSRLEKRKNDEETEEAWVQCDKCNQWNHQVCALFNGRRNEGGEAEYTCPQCCMAEIERGERKPLLSCAVLGAKDLPKTFLSDHLEQRLARKLKHERSERARVLGKCIDEVPGADSLVVRVVSSVDKKLEVKQRFMEIFQEEDYPTEFPYKSKVVLLFQKIEGVEVCLFGMYVQEFGVECQHPNQRRVYLSYLDSVKYFRPDVKTVNGEALRTYVYHEILIAYLDYCKKRGFSSCYIWACPPLKGEDYILYCHPEIQKTPKSDKLRDWYLTMLKKATSDGIVVEVTNLYDHFFVSTGECKAKVTAARLPYFDGDYWPGAAEDMIVQLQQEEEDGRKLQKKGKNKKTATKRASKAVAQAELASNASKDLQLMFKLGESILPMKEDFIMVHMHHACTHCRLFIVAGYRWTCKQCKNFQLCDRCHDAEQKWEERDRHPISIKEVHALTPIQVEEVPQETKDKDEFMESEFFDTRQAFLSLCQGNHYQYDTLRRAKHSSMMVLYHLHNPTAPAFVVTCNMCHRDIETGAGWRCETCPDFDLCNGCKDHTKHPHKLTPHPSASERNAQNKEARQQRVLQLRKMLELLVHASQCGIALCNYPKCRSVKGLFRHGMLCKTRASGGCALCKRMWYLLQLHARACKESDCRVPRCKDLKEHVRRSNQQQESRRRAAVMEMMRQRAAEAAGASS